MATRLVDATVTGGFIVAVPEPGLASMLSVGVGLLALAARWR